MLSFGPIVAGTSIALLTSVILFVMAIPTPAISCKIGCQCGQVQGNVQASSSLHIACYCDDCQLLSDKLQSKFPSMKPYANEQGGTEIIILFPSDVQISNGSDKLVQGKLKERTTTRRVYASCCGTPMFNVTKKNVPFLGLLRQAIVDKDCSLGQPQYSVWTKYAKDHVSGGSETIPTLLKMKILLRLLMNSSKTNPHPVDLKQTALVF